MVKVITITQDELLAYVLEKNPELGDVSGKFSASSAGPEGQQEVLVHFSYWPQGEKND